MLLLPTTLTHREARESLSMLGLALKRQTDADDVVVDASGLLHFDSSALAVLLECQRLAFAWGKGFVVRSAPPKLAQLAGLYGLDEAMTIEVGTPAITVPAAPADLAFADTQPPG